MIRYGIGRAAIRGGFVFLGAIASVGYTEPVAAPPSDDDADTTYTARTTAADGATIRPGRLWLDAAPDSLRNAELTGAVRLPADRFGIVASRVGRTRNYAQYHRIKMCSARAGEAWAPRNLVLEYDAWPGPGRARAADTTSRTSAADGASLVVPTVRLMHAADSIRNGDLKPSGTDQDRWRVRFDPGSTIRTGRIHRIQIVGSGRAGEAFAPRAITVEYDHRGTITARKAET